MTMKRRGFIQAVAALFAAKVLPLPAAPMPVIFPLAEATPVGVIFTFSLAYSVLNDEWTCTLDD